MNEIARTSESAVQRVGSLGSCPYCGAPLVEGYYFCVRCATPHAKVESVLPAVYVAPPSEGERIVRQAPHAWPLFWTYLGVILFSSFVCLLAFREDGHAYGIIFSSAAMFITTCVFAGLHWPSLAVQFKRLGFGSGYAWLGIAALVPLLALNYVFHELFLRSLAPIEDPLPAIRESLGQVGAILFICVLPALVEEIAFRGLLQHWLQVAIKPMRALILASALFTALHFSVISAPYLFAVGMLLGFVKLKTNSLWPCMIIHFLHNFAVVELFRYL